MSITEASRFQLRTAIGQILSEEAADTLMELLPPVGWADVATKTDLQHLRDELKGDINSLRVATKSDLQHLRNELKNDIDSLRNELKNDINSLRNELKGDMLNLQLTIEVNVRKLIHEQTKWLITTMIAMNAVTVAVAVALSKLI
jgi:flagellar basal body-associated protein FliL